MKNTTKTLLLAAITGIFMACDKNSDLPNTNATVMEASGDISDDLQAFKDMLGPLNTTPAATTGHREINWDGVPANMLDTPLPGDFFNQTAANASAANQRGLIYEPGTFMVSSNGFNAVNSEASIEFVPFSGNNAFANTTAARWDVKFQKAGTTQAASVNAFGAVFTDVDEENSTSLEFFDDEKSLGKFFVPKQNATSKFSFLGVRFTHGERVTKITVTHDGFLAEGAKDVSEGGSKDLIVLDDFIYSEPVVQ